MTMDAEPGATRNRRWVWWLAAAYVVLASGTAGLIFLRPPADRLADLHVYWGAARAVLHGRALYGFEAGNGDPFTYPPFAMVLFLPLGLVPEAVAGVVWTAATLVVFVVLARMVVTRWPLRWDADRRVLGWACAVALLVSAPGQSNVRFGQVSVFVVLLALTDAVGAVPSRWRGVLVGVAAAVKLTPLLFVGYFLAVGRRRDAVRAVAAFTGCGVLAAALMPGASRTYWTSAVVSTSRIGELAALGNQSVNGILLRAGVPDGWRPAVWALVLVVVCGGALGRARQLHRVGLEVHAVVLVGCATVAASPVSWTHHQFWTVLAAMLLVATPVSVHRARGWVVLAALTVNPADAFDRLRLGQHAVFLAANLRGLAAAVLCVAGFGTLAKSRVTGSPGETPPRVVSGAEEWLRRGPSRGVVAAAAAVVLVFAVTPLPSTANLGVAPATPLRIVFADLHDDPAAVNAELRRRHLGLALRFLPASPSLVGTQLGASVSEGAQDDRLASTFERRPGSTGPADVSAVTVPADLRGDILLFVGRPARPGEDYAGTPPGGAEAPGEVLHCHPVRGLRVTQSFERFAAAGVTPLWRTSTLDDDPRGVAYRKVADGYIDQVEPVNDRQVWVWVTDRPPTAPDHGRRTATGVDRPGHGCALPGSSPAVPSSRAQQGI